MTDPNDARLPPLGEPTPGRPARSGGAIPWYRRASVAGLAGLSVGVLIGLLIAAVVDDPDDSAGVEREAVVETTVRPTTTTRPPLPRECADAIRSAEQSLALLDQAFRNARRLDVSNVDRMLADLDELRRRLTERVRTCLENA